MTKYIISVTLAVNVSGMHPKNKAILFRKIDTLAVFNKGWFEDSMQRGNFRLWIFRFRKENEEDKNLFIKYLKDFPKISILGEEKIPTSKFKDQKFFQE